ncbi:polyketide cyclase [Glaciibacter flavus]|uniref:Polyketide cyclase n=1 Tax=Orlajensenia flava TaxID=2565934 RepID=A0A4S4FUT0_9MICO|nr:SRPBCC family protein [Glaciibacter flavus]THG34483.1 polyketide cyclase [Glaciibacter flavus]
MSTTTNALTVTAPEGAQYVEFVREFDHPVAAVFAAHGDPELIKHWLGPRGLEMEVEEYDFTTGGSYSYVHSRGDEHYRFRGVFHVVRENEFAVQTFEFEGFPDVVSIETIRFEDLGDGRTRLSGHATYPTLEARDGMVQSGMETGMSEGYDRLEELLAR